MTDHIATRRPHLVSGIWKFRTNILSPTPVTPEVLVALTREWCREFPSQHLEAHVRGCGKDQIGINVMIDLGPDVSLREYVYRISDKLRRQFGNDFVGWDLSDSVWVVE